MIAHTVVAAEMLLLLLLSPSRRLLNNPRRRCSTLLRSQACEGSPISLTSQKPGAQVQVRKRIFCAVLY
jgi:hypothetical protein